MKDTLLSKLFPGAASAEVEPGFYERTIRLPEPRGVRFGPMSLGITPGRVTVTGTVELKGDGWRRLRALAGRRSRGWRKHVRRVKAERRNP